MEFEISDDLQVVVRQLERPRRVFQLSRRHPPRDLHDERDRKPEFQPAENHAEQVKFSRRRFDIQGDVSRDQERERQMDNADQGMGAGGQPVRNPLRRAGSALLRNVIYTVFVTGSKKRAQ